MTEATAPPQPDPPGPGAQPEDIHPEERKPKSVLQRDVIRRARKVINARWLPDRIPENWPFFDMDISDGCTGVRQIAQECCVVHDADYWYSPHWTGKIAADWRLMLCIWKTGFARASAERNPEPWTTLPAWVLLGIGRFIGVSLFGWGPFYRKAHKRKGWKPSAAPQP